MKKVKKFCVALMIVLGTAGMVYGCAENDDSNKKDKKETTSSTKASKKTTGISKGYGKLALLSAVEGSSASAKGEVSNEKGEEIAPGTADNASECVFFASKPKCVDGGKTAVVCVPNSEAELDKIEDEVEKILEGFEKELESIGIDDDNFDPEKLEPTMKEKFNKVVAKIEEIKKSQSSIKGKWMKYPCASCKVGGELPSFDLKDLDDDIDLSLECSGKDIFDDDYNPSGNGNGGNGNGGNGNGGNGNGGNGNGDASAVGKLPDFYKLGAGKATVGTAKKHGACDAEDDPVCDNGKVYICTPKAEDSPKLEAAFKEFWSELAKNQSDPNKIEKIEEKFEKALENIKGTWMEYNCGGCVVNDSDKGVDDIMCDGKSVIAK